MSDLPTPFLWLALLLPIAATAGPLYGTVRLGGGAAGGIGIEVACPSLERPEQGAGSTVTDPRGSFSLLVPATGRCQMRLRRGAEVGAPFDVFSSDNPLRFDLQIDRALNRVGG